MVFLLPIVISVVKTKLTNIRSLNKKTNGGLVMYYSNGNYEAFAHPEKPVSTSFRNYPKSAVENSPFNRLNSLQLC